MTDQQQRIENAEKIAAWLGMSETSSNILDNYPYQFYMKWLSSDAGTVAMILKIGESRQWWRITIIQSGGKWIVRIIDWYRDADTIDYEAKEESLNAALQSAILEVIKE